jgi:hypothetical protein
LGLSFHERHRVLRVQEETEFLVFAVFLSLSGAMVHSGVWYLVPAIFGKIETLWIELAWAFVVVIVSGLFAIIVETELEPLKISKGFKILVFALFVVSMIFFVRFSFGKPWIDVFVDPYTL